MALKTVDPAITFPSVESVGPKVSGELIWTAVMAVAAAIGAVLVYIWLRFEWQFSLGAVAALAQLPSDEPQQDHIQRDDDERQQGRVESPEDDVDEVPQRAQLDAGAAACLLSLGLHGGHS